MKAFPVTLDTWDVFKSSTGRDRHDQLTFPLQIVEAIGKPHGLEMVRTTEGTEAIFVACHDFSSLLSIPGKLRKLGVEPDRAKRIGPLVWCGGQGTFNPLPLAGIADLVVLGDAEESLPQLLSAYSSTGPKWFLSRAAEIPGVFVPSLHDESVVTLQRGYASDVSVTLRNRIFNTAGIRVEITRGCRSKCSFCGLGWMGAPRHNSAVDVLTSVNGSPSVHLQACDTEAHPEMLRIRETMARRGQIDTGCTSRLDSHHAGVSAFLHDKMFNFGIEGLSESTRAKVGKARLTDNFIVAAMLDLYRRMPSGVTGEMVAWHMIAGLPGEDPSRDAPALADVLQRIDRGLFEMRKVGHLSIRWQPLFPQPGTPSQWLEPGRDAKEWSRTLARCSRGLCFLRVHHVAGRHDRKHMASLSVARARRLTCEQLDMISKAKTEESAASVAGVSLGALDPSEPLPWDFIHGQFERNVIEKAYRKLVQQ